MQFKLQSFPKSILKNSFLMGSLIMVLGSNLYNFSQFAYHFLAGRLLGKAAYGDLAAIISIIGVVVIIQSALGMTIVKFIASSKNEKEIPNFIKWVYLWSLWLAVIVVVIVLLLSPYLINFLNITQPAAVYFLGPILLFYILANAGRSILQGLLKFRSYVVSLLVESIVKIPLAILFITLGFATLGALGGLLAGVLVSFLISRFLLSFYLSGKRSEKPELVSLLKYSFATFFQGLALTSMYSMDLVLVKHFFSPDLAGIYASLAILGRIVFFGAAPITSVMFPIVAKKHSRGDSHLNIIYLSLALITMMAVFVIFLFYFFPQLIIGTFYGAGFIEGSSLLWWFGVFMGLLALAMLITQYYLSIGHTRVVGLFVVAAFLQIILIWMIHPNLLTVIQLSIVSAALLVGSLFVYSMLYKVKSIKRTSVSVA